MGVDILQGRELFCRDFGSLENIYKSVACEDENHRALWAPELEPTER